MQYQTALAALVGIVVGLIVMFFAAKRMNQRSNEQLEHELHRRFNAQLLGIPALGGVVAGIASVGGAVSAVCLTIIGICCVVTAAVVMVKRS